MEQTGVKNPKLRSIFAIIIAVLLLAYIVAMAAMPIITYTRTSGDQAGQEEQISLMTYLWRPFDHQDFSGAEPLKSFFQREFQQRYETPINQTIAPALFAFLVAFISMIAVLLGRKKPWNVFFPIIWSVVSLVLYLLNPFMNGSFINSTTKLVHMIIFAVVLVVAVIDFFMISLPKMRYDAGHREKY